MSKQHTDYKQPDDAAFQALERIKQTLAARNIRLYFAVMPQHQEPPEKDDKLAVNISVFNERARKIVQFNQGYFLDMHELMELGGKYFVDRVHLNDEGASAVAEILASVVDAEP